MRTQARELERTALDLFGPLEHSHADADSPGSIPHALNRLSSAVYLLELLFVHGELAWQV